MFGRRAALAALNDPVAGPTEPTHDPMVATEASLEPTDDERRAVWRHAGLVREAAGLGRLRSSRILLVRLLAAAALARAESRGGHFRADFPSPDPALDGFHTVTRQGSPPVMERWA
jgi:L-aspartate oxidase